MNAHLPADSADAIDVHDPALTAVQIAQQLDEVARALNYATLPRVPRLDHAADVYSVIGSLQAALSKLPQACGQLAAFLDRQQAAGTLRAERGFPHADRPVAAVEDASFKLGQVAVAARVTATALGAAQTAISGLSQGEARPAPPTTPISAAPCADLARVVEP